MSETILVIGSSGQIGTELVEELRNQFGNDKVIASDIKEPQNVQNGPFEVLDILNKEQLLKIVEKHNVKEIYLLAALLSATAEKNPEFAWELNMNSLFNVLNLAKDGIIKKIFWPSSIAVFGPTTPRENTPQYTIMEPSTVYGISKQAGERWCEYYNEKYGVDVRSIRYPGLIGYKSLPGGGTTDYAVDIFHQAIKHQKYECFLNKSTRLPMMYMADAIKATIQIMQAPSENIKIRSSYNLAGISFNPEDISSEIKKYIPSFSISYKEDFRQKIADSWPQSIDDTNSKKDWNWYPEYNLESMSADMIKNLKNIVT
ncbi:NAD-dependent epimerase/dehydratase family protein [Vicingus serpentipes]|uniref:NAD-dependent epimerase/dehydratase family protein n=1 Tax=Vicingus serpentipes TaxID=1926625 RepID=A0A5C6RNX2_9FLAO|nr:NAD-dependent epimerase/dehydratase family protein [Vicingus serpentipes]TXB64031.1 NAD-dependent epimerase/dehydratase family protein [Vicingus serpentipes]